MVALAAAETTGAEVEGIDPLTLALSLRERARVRGINTVS